MTNSNLEPERDGTSGGAPTSGSFGAQPAGTGLGAAAGGVAVGALAGSISGPVGAVVGAAIGAMAGGLAGRGIANAIDTAAEEGYWRENFSSRPYVKGDSSFEVYGPAYRFGVDSYARLGDHSFEQAVPELERMGGPRGGSQLSWQAPRTPRDAWQHVSDAIERVTPGDTDRDGK
ncbi:MAG: hypothetical protein IPJ97_05810 [Proteobacteria bacterium]|nr:hypothetical protein [Pseudomonadota bacterium]